MAEETPMRWAKWRPMAEIVCEVRELSPPRDSKSKEMKEMLAEAQGAWWRSLFRDSSTCNAYPGVVAAPWMVRCWSEQITEMSKAAGRPRSQLGKKMSAGRDWQLGIRWGDSLHGARAAVWAAVKIASQMELWRKILSPLLPHPTWWSPKQSAGKWQTEHIESAGKRGRPSQ